MILVVWKSWIPKVTFVARKLRCLIYSWSPNNDFFFYGQLILKVSMERVLFDRQMLIYHIHVFAIMLGKSIILVHSSTQKKTISNLSFLSFSLASSF